MVDRTTPIPLYYQITEDLKQQIAGGQLKQGEKLPTEKWLTEHYNVSRVTIRKALSELFAQGYVECRRGKGNYVSARKVQLSLSSMTSLYQALSAAGIQASSRILSEEFIRVPAQLAAEAGFEEGEPVRVIHRIRLADGEPITDQTTYLRERFCHNLETKSLENASLYNMLSSKCHICVGRSFHVFSTKMPTKEDMENLTLKKRTPLLSIRASVYNTDEEIVEYSINNYVPDRYCYSITLNY